MNDPAIDIIWIILIVNNEHQQFTGIHPSMLNSG